MFPTHSPQNVWPRIWIFCHKWPNSFLISWVISATYCSFGSHSRTLFDFQLTSGTSLTFAHAIENFYKSIKYYSWKKYLGRNTELAYPNIIPKGASTYSKNYMTQTFSGGSTDVHGDKNISAEKRTHK